MRILNALVAASAASLIAVVGAACSSTSTGTGTPDQDGAVPPGNDAGNTGVDAPVGPPVDATGPAAGNTGAACALNTNCLATTGQVATCRLKSAGGIAYPGGYCVSSCVVAHNNMNDMNYPGINPDCPGIGTCVGSAATGTCFAMCFGATSQLPCRTGYSCFAASGVSDACLPTPFSECDPTQKGTCPANDAGMPQTCVQAGPDPIGQCNDGCDVFAQGCTADTGGPRYCYANQFGEGLCANPSTGTGATDGMACQYLNDCAQGLGCHNDGTTAAPNYVCHPYCGGAGNKACNNGKQCVDFSATVLKATVGVCAG